MNAGNDCPVLTIVSAHKNDLAGLRRTLASLRPWDLRMSQVVVDGSNSAEHRRVRALLEGAPGVTMVDGSSAGIYKAMEDGLARAPGKYVMFLNAGDELHPGLDQRRFLDEISHLDFDWAYGRVALMDSTGNERPAREFSYAEEMHRHFRRGRFPQHPATLVSREFAALVGPFSQDLKIAADYEYMLRMAKLSDPFEIDRTLVRFHLGGVSSRRWLASSYQAHKARTSVYEMTLGESLVDAVMTAPTLVRAAASRVVGRL